MKRISVWCLLADGALHGFWLHADKLTPSILPWAFDAVVQHAASVGAVVLWCEPS